MSGFWQAGFWSAEFWQGGMWGESLPEPASQNPAVQSARGRHHGVLRRNPRLEESIRIARRQAEEDALFLVS